MTDKEKIREVIEKRYEYWKEKESNSHSIESEIRMSECKHLLLMLNSLQEEPVSEDLTKEIDNIKKEYYADDPHAIVSMMGVQIEDIAHHFVEWQKKQIMKDAKLSGWVARDKNGSLHIFEVEPRRNEDRFQWWDRDYDCATLDDGDFPELKWEDEPVYVKLIIIKEDQI